MPNPIFPLETLLENLPSDERWLRPAEAAAFIGFDVKWLADVREGRKGITGPPFIKVGSGRTSPIRYQLSSLIEWMKSFPVCLSTTRHDVVMRRNFVDFSAYATDSEKWLFSISRDGRQAIDVFEALKQGNLPDGTRLRWLTLGDFKAQRFIRHDIVFRADMLNLLNDAGDGDVSVGLDRLLGYML